MILTNVDKWDRPTTTDSIATPRAYYYPSMIPWYQEPWLDRIHHSGLIGVYWSWTLWPSTLPTVTMIIMSRRWCFVGIIWIPWWSWDPIILIIIISRGISTVHKPWRINSNDCYIEFGIETTNKNYNNNSRWNIWRMSNYKTFRYPNKRTDMIVGYMYYWMPKRSFRKRILLSPLPQQYRHHRVHGGPILSISINNNRHVWSNETFPLWNVGRLRWIWWSNVPGRRIISVSGTWTTTDTTLMDLTYKQQLYIVQQFRYVPWKCMIVSRQLHHFGPRTVPWPQLPMYLSYIVWPIRLEWNLVYNSQMRSIGSASQSVAWHFDDISVEEVPWPGTSCVPFHGTYRNCATKSWPRTNPIGLVHQTNKLLLVGVSYSRRNRNLPRW